MLTWLKARFGKRTVENRAESVDCTETSDEDLVQAIYLVARVELAAGVSTSHNTDNLFGETVLRVALLHPMQRVASLLDEWAAALQADTTLGQRLLAEDANLREVENVRWLIDHGAGLEGRDALGRTPLINAVDRGYDGSLSLLLDSGADLEAKDSSGQTALAAAVLAGNMKTLGILIERGARLEDADTCGRTALLLAAKNGHTDAVALLLRNGADVNATDDDGMTPLMFAASEGRTEAVRLLLESGADMYALPHDRLEKNSAMELAAENGHFEAMSEFLKVGTDRWLRGRVLLDAVKSGCQTTLSRLLESYEDPVEKEEAHSTALPYAAWNDKTDIVMMLLRRGVDVNVRDEPSKTTALIEAARNGSPGLVALLLEQGADPRCRDYMDESAYDCARRRRNEEIAQLVAAACARLEATALSESLADPTTTSPRRRRRM